MCGKKAGESVERTQRSDRDLRVERRRRLPQRRVEIRQRQAALDEEHAPFAPGVGVARELPLGQVGRRDRRAARSSLADVLDDLRSFAMFGGGKVVVIRNGDEFITRYRPQLEDYVQRFPADSFMRQLLAKVQLMGQPK